MPGEQAIEGELDFEHFPRRNVAQVDAFYARVGAEYVDSETVADEQADHRILDVAPGDGADTNADGFVRFEISGRLATCVDEVRTDNFTGSVAVAKTCAGLGQIAARLVALLPFEHQADVAVHHFAGIAEGGDASFDHQRGAIGKALDESEIVRDEQDGDLAFLELHELLDATVGEDRVADGERFVHNQNFGIDVNRRGEREANVHPGGIFFHRPIHKRPDFGKAFDRRKHAVHVRTRDAEDFSIQEDVFTTREFRVEAGAQFELRRDSTARDYPTAGWLQNAADDLKKSALAAAIGADDAKHLTSFDVERYIAKSPKFLGRGMTGEGKKFNQPVGRPPV